VRAIAKAREPASFTTHRQANPEDYQGYGDKNTLRNALVTEQRGICCYCMGRIRNENGRMKIEHWRCQERYPADRLRYGNLLGACLGSEGQPLRLQHCDSSKGNRDLLWNPADAGHQIETRIWYEGDGRIRSNDQTFDYQLSAVLNLNLAVLMRNRKEVLDGIVAWWKSEKAKLHGPVPRARFMRERQRLVGGNGDLRAFCQVAVWWIEMRLS
jgi:uncharacterized protein (TIGR02646 family)